MLSMNIVDCYKVCLLQRLVSWSEAPREMLLLADIHFHAGQLVADLVFQTLGIGKRVRTKSMTFIKRIFTQEIPVAAELSSSSITGYLPVHCIQQLLSRPTIEKAVPWLSAIVRNYYREEKMQKYLPGTRKAS